MWRWILGGLAALAVYGLAASSVYSRARWEYDRKWNLANYRVTDAEELRREAAQNFALRHGAGAKFEKDPAYRAADAKVTVATQSYPSDAGVIRLRADEIRFGEWGVAAYLGVLLVVAIRRRFVS